MTRPAAPDARTFQALRGCLEACRRCEMLVEQVTGSPVAEPAYAAIGPHLRHCLDHFVCLLRGLDSGVVDYDDRDRDGRLELEPPRFRAALETIVARLGSLADGSTVRTLQVRQAAAPGGTVVEVTSSLERELVFLSGHTIHHLAIMKMLAEARGVSVPGNLDFAFSTEAHLEAVD